MDKIYLHLGAAVFYGIVGVIVVMLLLYCHDKIGFWLKKANWIHYYIQRHTIESEILRDLYKAPWVVKKRSNRKYIFLYRLRNIRVLKSKINKHAESDPISLNEKL